MPIKAQQVYDMAMVLIDEVSETGSLAVENPGYYQAKSLSILTTLQTELLPLSVTPVAITDLQQDLLLNERISLSVLPYGLAAHILLAENAAEMASFYNNRYDELKKKIQTGIMPIEDKYDVLGGMRGEY